MKQHISIEDLQSITVEQKEKLREWWEPALFDVFYNELKWGDEDNSYIGVIDRWSYEPDPEALPLLSIGQLIEFLQDNLELPKYYHTNGDEFNIFFNDRDILDWTPSHTKQELCDALWEAVKEVLK